ncbi:MAG: hypothetical protein M0P20_02985 [Methanocorpusculum sp.]|nr:hypothetical protein [Methanocorpusculum sp.]
MKEIVITTKRIHKELFLLLACFIFAFLLNVVAVIIYSTPVIEIFTQVGYVIAITLVLYFFITLIRGILFFVKRLFRRT